MAIMTADLPADLIPQVKAGFLEAIANENPLWQQVAAPYNMTGAQDVLVDLGATPMPRESIGGSPLDTMIERLQYVEPIDWEIVIGISSNAIADNRTSQLMDRVRGAGSNFNRHINAQVFRTLNAGDGTTYGNCYDGLTFFNDAHIDAAAKNQAGQDNVYNLALDATNFHTVYTAHANFLDDQGEFLELAPDILLANIALRPQVINITGNPAEYDSADSNLNPYFGAVKPMLVPWLDSTAWMTIVGNRAEKPIIVAMREVPALKDVWRDPQAPKGGMNYFKFFGRYVVVYGLWHFACMGHS